MWIDENAYKEDCDEYLLFQYLYHIIGMLAFKRAFFNKGSLYNDFSIYGATVLFMRIKNPKHSGSGELPKIKSILNYAKKRVYPLKVNFEQESYAQVISKDFTPSLMQASDLYEPAHNDQFTRVDFVVYARDIPKTIKTYIYSKPLSRLIGNPQDLYMSVLLTFLNSITLPKDIAKSLREYGDRAYRNPRVVNRLYKNETANPIILYNISKRYRNLVLVLYREVCDLIAEDISNIYKSHQYGEAIVKNMLLSTMFSNTGE